MTPFDFFPEWLYHIVFPIARWLHIACSTLLIGGTLFYEFVVPIALEDLKQEQQLALVGRVRWVFARVVWFSVIVMMITGALSAWRGWQSYETQYPACKPWFSAHVALGALTMAAALRLTLSRRVPPLSWMRINLVLLLVVVFLASVSRHVRLTLREKLERAEQSRQLVMPLIRYQWSDPELPTTQPNVVPSTQP